MTKRWTMREGFIFISMCMLLGSSANYISAEEPQAGKMTVWCASDMERVLPDAKPEEKNAVWDKATGSLVVKGARNEYLSAQIVIRAEGGVLQSVNVTCGTISGPGELPAGSIKLHRVWYMTLPEDKSGKGGEYPNQIIPFSASQPYGAPFSIDGSVKAGDPGAPEVGGRNQPVWLDILVPEGATPGEYCVPLTISAENTPPQTVTLKLTVWDFTLPKERHLRTWAPYYVGYIESGEGVKSDRPNGEEKNTPAHINDAVWDILKEYYCLMHEHRLDTSPDESWMKYAHMDFDRATGKVNAIDWENFDKYFYKVFATGEIFRDGVPSRSFELPCSFRNGTINHTTDEKSCPVEGGWLGPQFRCLARETAARIKEHFEEKKWPLDRAFMYFMDEPVGKMAYDIVRNMYPGVVEGGNDQVRFMMTVQPDPQFDFYNTFRPDAGTLSPLANPTQIEDCAHIWSPASCHFNPRDMLWEQTHGRECWYYGWGAKLKTPNPCVLTCAAAWVAWKYRVDGIFQWVINWAKGYDGRSWLDAYYTDTRNGDGLWIYMGKPVGVKGPVASLRLKAIRRGLQDYEYLWLLKESGDLEFADNVVSKLVYGALGETERNPWSLEENSEKWIEARELMAQRILQAAKSERTPNPPQKAENLTAESIGVAGRVELRWKANPEKDILGYAIYRSKPKSEEGVVAPELERIKMYGEGVTRDTAYVDQGLKNDEYYYQVAAVNKAGEEGERSELASVTVETTYKKLSSAWYCNGVMPTKEYKGARDSCPAANFSIGNNGKTSPRYWVQFGDLEIPKDAKILRAKLRLSIYGGTEKKEIRFAVYRPESVTDGKPSEDYFDADGVRNGHRSFCDQDAGFDVTSLLQGYVSGKWTDTGFLVVLEDEGQVLKNGHAVKGAPGLHRPRLEISFAAKE